MTSMSSNPNMTDIIMILDMSGSMGYMGKEPIESLNAFIDEQKSQKDNATFTLVVFNNNIEILYNHICVDEMTEITEEYYKPSGATSLNDAICSTIENEFSSRKLNKKVVVIITDGKDNSSQLYTTNDTKNKIKDCQDNHNWSFIFIGANVNSFEEGFNINIGLSYCGQFDQYLSGDLLRTCRQTSSNITEFRRSRTEGIEIPELLIAPTKILSSVSCPPNILSEDNMGPLPLKRSDVYENILSVDNTGPLPLKRSNACANILSPLNSGPFPLKRSNACANILSDNNATFTNQCYVNMSSEEMWSMFN
jgi:uncharacterized protein YegL